MGLPFFVATFILQYGLFAFLRLQTHDHFFMLCNSGKNTMKVSRQEEYDAAYCPTIVAHKVSRSWLESKHAQPYFLSKSSRLTLTTLARKKAVAMYSDNWSLLVVLLICFLFVLVSLVFDKSFVYKDIDIL